MDIKKELAEINKRLQVVFDESTLGDIPEIKKSLTKIAEKADRYITDLEVIVDEDLDDFGCLHNGDDDICNTCGTVRKHK